VRLCGGALITVDAAVVVAISEDLGRLRLRFPADLFDLSTTSLGSIICPSSDCNEEMSDDKLASPSGHDGTISGLVSELARPGTSSTYIRLIVMLFHGFVLCLGRVSEARDWIHKVYRHF
jgi:hypothetical protein